MPYRNTRKYSAARQAAAQATLAAKRAEREPRDAIELPASHLLVQEAYWATPWEGAAEDQCWWSTPHGPAGRGYTILPRAITHWMPLPPPPKEIA